VLSAIERALGIILRSGKAAGILTTDETLARRYLSLGFTFVAVGLDAVLLANATTQLAAKFQGPVSP
jgi:4-hydroxy-2-oxoheptanedioate aldolase